MKLLLLLLIPVYVWGQNIPSTIDTEIILLNYKESIDIGDVNLKFEKVLTDSRCPSDVNCICAGEAIVLVDVYNKGEHIYDKELIMDTSGTLSDSNNLIFASDTIKVFSSKLFPYPKTTETKDIEKYYLEILVQSLQ
jgi:hypothetical protein